MTTFKEYQEMTNGDGVDPASFALPRAARTFQGKRAGFASRLLAGIIDVGLVFAFVVFVQLIWGIASLLVVGNDLSIDWWDSVPHFVVGGCLFVLYATGSWRTTGRTFGDQILGLRVVTNDGQLLRTWSAFLRAGFIVLFPVGFFWILLSGSNRSVQDIIMQTSVIYDWQVRVPRVASRRRD